MKKMIKQLQIEKTTISRLIHLKFIEGGEGGIGGLSSVNCPDSRWPIPCPPPPPPNSNNNIC